MPDPKTNDSTTSEAQTLSDEHMNHLVSVTLDGKEEMRPLKEVAAGFQKSVVADQRFREAHQLKESVATDIRIAEDLREGLAKRDPSIVQRAFRNAGLSQEQVDTAFAAASEQQPADDPGAATGGDETVDPESVEGQLTSAIVALQQEVEALKTDRAETAQATRTASVLGQVKKALDDDPDFATIMSTLDADELKDFQELAFKYVRKASETTPFDRGAIPEGLKKLKARRKAWGGDDGTQDDDVGRAPGVAGLGPAGTTGSHLHTQPPHKKVPVGDDNFAQSLLARFRAMKPSRR